MKIQVKDQLPVLKNRNKISKPLHKEIKKYVEEFLSRVCPILIQLLFTDRSSAQERCNFSAILWLSGPTLLHNVLPKLLPNLLSNIQDILNSLSRHIFFSVLHKFKTYHQLHRRKSQGTSLTICFSLGILWVKTF